MAESRFVTVNGLKLHYLDFGGSGKPPLVCLHGLSGNAHNFDALGPILAAAYHVISLDVRGRGDSQWGPAQEYTPVHYAADLAAMVNALGLGRVTLIGTSMGGLISIIYAGTNPAGVERLVLNDIGPEVAPAGLIRIMGYFTAAPGDFANLAEVAAYHRKHYPALAPLGEDELIESIKSSIKPGPAGRLMWKLDPAVRIVPPPNPAAPPPNLWGVFRLITAPVLVIRGSQSDILSPATAAQMRAAVADLKVVEVPGVAHAPSLSEPAALAAIREFLHV